MRVERLQLRNFRNYAHETLLMRPGLNVFVGENAQGKSNLMEALFAISSTRSVRTHREEEVIRSGENWARIDATLSAGLQTWEAELFWEKTARGTLSKQARINKQDVRRYSELFNLSRMVLFSADDLVLVAGAPEHRRRFLDYLLSKVSRPYMDALQHYQQVLKQRNEWLRSPRGALKPVLDEQLLAWGQQVTAARAAGIADLTQLAARYYQALAPGDPPLSLQYRASLPLEGDAAPVLAARAAEEIQRGTTLVGPHRDDLGVRLGDQAVRAFGSRGQLRCTALALRLAEGDLMQQKCQDSVVYLLDDCMSELDPQRQAFLWDHLAAREQVLVTGTPDIRAEAEQRGYWIRHIHAGRVQDSPSPLGTST
ncbi:MAG: DNA replication/repair protein RecF [Candidatus Xenobia bacterium]